MKYRGVNLRNAKLLLLIDGGKIVCFESERQGSSIHLNGEYELFEQGAFLTKYGFIYIFLNV